MLNNLSTNDVSILLVLIGIIFFVSLLIIVACVCTKRQYVLKYYIMCLIVLILLCIGSIRVAFRTDKISQDVTTDYSLKDNFTSNLETIAIGVANGNNSLYFKEEVDEIERVLSAGKKLDTFYVTDDVVENIYSNIDTPIPQVLLCDTMDLVESSDNTDSETEDSDIMEPMTVTTSESTYNKGLTALLNDPNYNIDNSLTEDELRNIVESNRRDYREYNLMSKVEEIFYTEKDSKYYKYLFTNKLNDKCSVTFKCSSIGCIQDVVVLRG